MTDHQLPQGVRKKTPSDASEFEREQLRFLLSGNDLATTLATINPSLAWLPVLYEMQLIQGENQLINWIERNFSYADAVRDVVSNLHFFGPETAMLLEYRLNAQAANLSPLLLKCWRLIIRNMKETKRGQIENEWFDIEPQVKRGDPSAALLERIAETLRPKLKLSKRLSIYDEARNPPEYPVDLMSLDYEVGEYLSADEVLEAWPKAASANTDSRLLSQLTTALEGALEDATEVGVETNEGYSISDSDVPSVAQHGQNTYRSGFHAIVRVMAELWSGLAGKSPEMARPFVQRWRSGPFRLLWRLALFACANPVVSADFAAETLIALPSSELFLTSSSVEVYRLIRLRWIDFDAAKQQTILNRLCEGPPKEWFRDGAEIDRAIDRSRFDILAEMVRDGFDIGEVATKLLAEIKTQWPNIELRPAEQAGFHSWHSSSSGAILGDADKLVEVADNKLVEVAKKVAIEADFMDGDNWQALCSSDPDRAFRGLKEAASTGDWPLELWQQLLWSSKEYAELDTAAQIAQLLLDWPQETFAKIVSPASHWLNGHVEKLDDTPLWRLGDRIADASLIENAETGDE